MEPAGAVAQNQETVADFGPGPAGEAARWISELDLSDRDHKRFLDTGNRVIRDYEAQKAANEQTGEGFASTRYALLWDNMQTIAPAVMARPPQAVVGRRWKDADPLARIVSEVLERCLNFTIDATDFEDIAKGVSLDFLLVGRGVPWARYVPHFDEGDDGQQVGGEAQLDAPGAADGQAAAPQDGQSDGSDPQTQPAEPNGEITDDQNDARRVAWEECIFDHVSWDDFRTNPARKWSEVRWVARCAYLVRDELVKRFGEKLGKLCPLDHRVGDAKADANDDRDNQFAKAAVWEIWDITSRKVFWISKGLSETPLDVRPDPLKLTTFFPCPRPAMATRSPRSVLPIPDYYYYRRQAKVIEDLTGRIETLQEALRVVGFYSAGGEEKDALQNALTGSDNKLIPVESWAAFAEKGGVKGIIEWLPIDMVASTVKTLIDVRTQLLADADRLSGVADAQRGEVDPNETATATNAKVNWGSLRIRDKQKEMARLCRDCLRIGGEIIAKQFSPETMAGMSNVELLQTGAQKQQLQAQLQQQAQAYQQAQQMAQQAGQQPPPPPPPPPANLLDMLSKPTWEDVTGLMQSDTMRSFRIDIETDSTIEPDDQEEKQRRVEFVDAIGSLTEKMLPLMQVAPQMLPVAAQAMLFLVRGFRVGREMEDVIEKAMDQLSQAGASGQGQQQSKGPNPQVEQAQAQAAQTTANARQMDAQTAQFRAQTERGQAIASAQHDQAQIAAENQRTQAGLQADNQAQHTDIAADMAQAVIKSQERSLIRDINNQHPIEAPTR